MSQKAIMIRVNGNLHDEIWSSVPDRDEVVRICKDFGYTESYDDVFGYIEVEYEWIEIGDGESGTDEFIDDETLLHIYDAYGYEDVIKEYFGYEVESIERGSFYIDYTELEDGKNENI